MTYVVGFLAAFCMPAFVTAIAPVNLDSARREAYAFVSDAGAPSLTLLAVANWKFSVFAGVPLTLLAALYAVGVVLVCLRRLRRLIKRT